MKAFKEMDYHPIADKLALILCARTQNSNPIFFRTMVAYYFSTMSSSMRCSVLLPDKQEIPTNMYAVNLMVSGGGKGKAANILEEEITHLFREAFVENTVPVQVARQLPKLALARAQKAQSDPDEELVKVEREFNDVGEFVYAFDSGTGPAVKQARHKLLMAKIGALNFQMDEVGSNFLGNTEVINIFLELYDKGKIKPKLVKNTSDNSRYAEIFGMTPANVMWFGTPSALLDGGKTEDDFYKMLETGYARRPFFVYVRDHVRGDEISADQKYKNAISTVTSTFLSKLASDLSLLADPGNLHKQLTMSESVAKSWYEYENDCLRRANLLNPHEELRKAELSHRYFKTIKLAATYAFIDSSPEILQQHLEYAIKLAEDCGKCLELLLKRDKPYVKLANYLASVGREVTQVDLLEDLPFFKGSQTQRSDLIQLAVAHGYQNNIIIKKNFVDGIEFLRGETLKRTDLAKMIVSYSGDLATGYEPAFPRFDQLHKMTQAPNVHWANHHFVDKHRQEDNAIPGFNMVVLDVEKSVDIHIAKDLLKDYKALFYTTKRHTDAEHRYRIILPTNYELKLDGKDFKEFMASLFQWLPFDVDTATGQRARKWLSNTGNYFYQDGELLDVLPFIPKTSKNEAFKDLILDQTGMDNLERWVINNTGDGNRNNMLLRYGMILVDAGFDFNAVSDRINTLNNKLPDKLDPAEIVATIMSSVAKAISKK